MGIEEIDRVSGKYLTERRAARRAATTLRARVIGTRQFSAVIENVSLTGMLLKTGRRNQESVGRTLEIRFELPGGRTIETQAVVVRNDGTTMGVQFMRLTADEQALLRDFVVAVDKVRQVRSRAL